MPSRRSYSATNIHGAGRDVLTGLCAVRAAATSPGDTSTPSRPSLPSMTTVSGTTVRLLVSPVGRAAVESVTTAIRGVLAGMPAR
jgi:hypothetical protein